MAHDALSDGRNIRTAEQNWDSGMAFGPRSNTYRLMRALLSEAERVDDDLESVYHAHHIDTAEDEELEQFGALVNAPRNSGEPDNKYRTRIKAEFAQAKTNTDFDSFVEFSATVLGTSIDNLEFSTNYAGNPATVTVAANPGVYDSVSLTAEEIADILGGGIPAGHEVLAQEAGTFFLKSDGDTDTAENGLTSDSISTGGTLATDIL